MLIPLMAFLKKQYRVEQIDPGMNIREGLGLDSLDMMDLLSFLEDKIGRRVSDTELESMVTVQDVVDFLERSIG